MAADAIWHGVNARRVVAAMRFDSSAPPAGDKWRARLIENKA